MLQFSEVISIIISEFSFIFKGFYMYYYKLYICFINLVLVVFSEEIKSLDENTLAHKSETLSQKRGWCACFVRIIDFSILQNVPEYVELLWWKKKFYINIHA